MTSAGERRPIVLGVDALHVSPMVVAWAADAAARHGAPLRLVHGVREELRDLRGTDGAAYHQVLRQSGEAALGKAAALVHERHPELAVESVLIEGNPAPVLCRESAGARLLVLGSRRLNRLEEVISGYSVTVPVSAQAHCPVAVVRAPEHSSQEPPSVVVGVDGSPASEHAVAFAAELAEQRGAAMRAVAVWQTTLYAPADADVAAAGLRRRLHEATAGCRTDHPDLDVTHEVLTGHPVEELARVSAHALAVVVGRRGHGGFTGMRLGSVPHGLLHHAPCPVVTVPTPAG